MEKLWKMIIVGLTGLMLAGTAIGVVLAQSEDDTTTTPAPAEDGDGTGDAAGHRVDEFVARLADNLGVSEEDLRAAIQQTQLDLVDQALADGRIDEEQAQRLRERIESGDGLPIFGRPHGPRPGAYLGMEVAEFLGIGVEELRDARLDGQSLAQIAEANGLSRDNLIAFLIGEVEEATAAKVEEGKIDQERADEIVANFSERVEDLVDNTEPPHRGPHGGPSGAGGVVEPPLGPSGAFIGA